jgi:hypothetical protein
VTHRLYTIYCVFLLLCLYLNILILTKKQLSVTVILGNLRIAHQFK